MHALILSGGRADFKQIKENLGSQEAYLNSEYFEEMLLAVTT